MFPGMMDPEMIRIAQEQMSRMSPAELSRIQQQMMSNPELMRMASDSMKYMKPEDLRNAAEQLKSTPDEMTEIGEKMANITPEELSTMRSRVDAQMNYQLSAAQMLKQKGNELHTQGRFTEALENYLRAKHNLKGIAASEGGTLLLACSLNLMSCYLKTNQYDECIKEGTEVLATDPGNVKALYRRGQAYKSLGQLENAMSDLTKALELSPDDDTIADVLRDAKEKLTKHGLKDALRGVPIEEITNEVPTPVSAMQCENTSGTSVLPTNTEYLQALKDDKESTRSFQNLMSQTDQETLASLGGGSTDSISPDMVKTATNVIGNMPPEEFQRMLEMATSFEGDNPLLKRDFSDDGLSSSNHGSGMPNVTADMLKTASDMMNTMPAEELQNMFKMASTLNGQDSASTEGALQSNGFRLDTDSDAQKVLGNSTSNEDIGESSTSTGVLNSRNYPQPSFPCSSSDMQEQLRNQMKNPAMREMMSSMMKSMSPDMMAELSEQFGYKLSQEDAEKAQQAMSSLSPENLDRMMKWADRIQRGVEGATNTKKWLLGRQGGFLGMALLVLLLAYLLHWLLN